MPEAYADHQLLARIRLLLTRMGVWPTALDLAQVAERFDFEEVMRSILAEDKKCQETERV